MHKENGVRVEKCTYASGGITGYVYSSKTRLPIENARVRISRKVRAGSGNGGNSSRRRQWRRKPWSLEP